MRDAPEDAVFIEALPRWRAGGDRRSVAGDAPTVWVDLDFVEAARALEPVDPAPQLAVASDGPGHLHAFWSRTRTARRVCTSTRTRRTDRSATAVDAAAASTTWPPGCGTSPRGAADFRRCAPGCNTPWVASDDDQVAPDLRRLRQRGAGVGVRSVLLVERVCAGVPGPDDCIPTCGVGGFSGAGGGAAWSVSGGVGGVWGCLLGRRQPHPDPSRRIR